MQIDLGLSHVKFLGTMRIKEPRWNHHLVTTITTNVDSIWTIALVRAPERDYVLN